MERKEIYKSFSFIVDTAGGSYSKKFELDKMIRVVKGIQLTADLPNMLYYRGSQRIEISGDELFPEGYESKLLLSGVAVAPDARWVDMGQVLSGNGQVMLLYKDTNNNSAPFTSYRVSLILKCELK